MIRRKFHPEDRDLFITLGIIFTVATLVCVGAAHC